MFITFFGVSDTFSIAGFHVREQNNLDTMDD